MNPLDRLEWRQKWLIIRQRNAIPSGPMSRATGYATLTGFPEAHPARDATMDVASGHRTTTTRQREDNRGS